MRTVSALVAAAIAVLVVAAPLAASAQPADQQRKTAAEAAFRQAKDELKAGKTAEACESFKKSQELDPQLGTQYNLALCYEKIGKLASAWGIFSELAATDTNAGRRADAGKREKAIFPRLVRVLVVVRGATPGLKITRSGVDITAAVGVATPVDPGMERVTAEAAGYESWTGEVSMAGEGTTITVEVPALVKLPEPPKPPDPDPGLPIVVPPEPAPPADPPPPGRGRRIAGITIGVVGLAAIGAGVGLGMSAQTANDDARALCGGDVTDCRDGALAAQDLIDKANSRALFSTIAFAAGGAAVVGGVVLYLTAPKDNRAREVSIAPALGATSAGVLVRGRF